MFRFVYSFAIVLLLICTLLVSLIVSFIAGTPPMMALHFQSAENDIVLWDTAQGLALPISHSVNHEVRPIWSNDGQYVAYLRWDRDLTNSVNYVPNLYVIRADGTGLRQIFNTGSVWSSETSLVRGAIRWSPDSSRLAFYYRVESRIYLHILTPHGDSLFWRNIRMDDDNILLWSGDGSRLYRFGRSQTGLRAYTLALDTPDAEYEFLGSWDDTRSAMASLYPSPMGRYILLYDPHLGRVELFDLDTANRQLIRTDGSLARVSPQWSPDGTAIAYYDSANDSVVILERDGTPILILPNPIRDDAIDQIVLSNAPYIAVVEMANHRCVLRKYSTRCIPLFGIRTSNNAIRPTQ